MRVEDIDVIRNSNSAEETMAADYGGTWNGRHVFHESGGSCRPSMLESSQKHQVGGGIAIGIGLVLYAIFIGLWGKGKIDGDKKGDKK